MKENQNDHRKHRGRKERQQVAATMAIEDMYVSKDFIEKLLKVSNGEMTTDDLIQELNKKYAQE